MDRNVTVTREELNGVHEFVLRLDGERYGSLEFSRPEVGLMRIDYVEVSPELRGRGFGKTLVDTAVAWARETQLKIRPICSYARTVMNRDLSMADMLA